MLQTKITAIAILALVYFIPCNAAVSTDSIWWTHFIYMFFHANIFHLIGNCYALFFLINKRNVIPAYIIAIIVSFVPMQPTVGVSSMIFAIIGMCRVNERWQKIYLYAYLVLGLIMPGINGIIHISSFVLGLLYKWYITNYNLFNNVYKRVNKGK